MIKPFKIIATRDDNGQGIGVVFIMERVSFSDDLKITKTETLETYALVPYEEDIDTYILNIVNESEFL